MNSTPVTLLDLLIERLREAASSFFPGVEEAPCAVLWTDPERAWGAVIPMLKQRLPELLVLGEYAPEERQGPVIWLKTAMAGKIPDVPLPPGQTPILYLPGVARHVLRNADQCPWEWQPLVELLYRGTVWAHRNGKDWTVEGFLVSEEGPALDLAKDDKTRLSLHSSLAVVAQTPLSRLQGKRLEASDFDLLVVGDTPRDLLLWIEHGDAVKSEWGSERWHAFRSRCRDEYGFDPESKPPLYAAEKLGLREESSWQLVWERYCEAPEAYGGIRERLDQAQPADRLALDAQAWPRENALREQRLGAELEKLRDVAAHHARQRIAELEQEHGERRGWVWAKQGDAPLAEALEHLARLAEATRSIPSFTGLAAFADWYAESGCLADSAALAAFRHANMNSESAVRAAIRSVYLPWLEELCSKFQVLFPDSSHKPEGFRPREGECLLFVDGLRLDVARELVLHLEAWNFSPTLETRFAALPTVTATAKPAVSPVFGMLSGDVVPADFAPLSPDGKSMNQPRFLKLLGREGIEVVNLESPSPSTPSARGWAETGRIDSRGHKLEADLAKQLPGELEQVAGVVRRLAEAGWRRVTLITDHGWLWMPGGLPKRELPGFLVESRWSRCAAIKGQSVPDVPVVPWHWNPKESVAVAPGACCFKAGMEYAHGGVSPQECVLPVIRVDVVAGSLPTGGARIDSVKWRRLRCHVTVLHPGPGLCVDLRREVGDAETSVLAGVKEVEADGQVSLLVPDESMEGRKVVVTLLSADGGVISKYDTHVGGKQGVE
ncbi:MAG: BREX-1 system phosphatase PglZ type B [Verrucomicrobia bacterium]|nr:BREX-1 system phosphatase PglZ type B [Verrucomicrobiota bacterium]MCH8511658.1 BREX-1 system phosphatase PglZ type B [Kiritimatiellia bacterium]